jgi:polyhydroxybutyrate depolymerase
MRLALLTPLLGVGLAACGGGRLAPLGATTSTTVMPTTVSPTTVSPTTVSPTAAPPSEPAFPTGISTSSIEYGGRTRTFQIFVPSTLPLEQAAPLVVQLHGGGGAGKSIDRLTRFNAIGMRENVMVVAPDGVDGNWNDGRTNVDLTAMRENIDDVGFLVAVVDAIGKHHRVDRRRVFAAGISNGAMMANRLACERSDRFAAVGLVAGTGPAEAVGTCSATGHVSVIAFNGTDDPLIPYNGGVGRRAQVGEVASVDATASYWTNRNDCNGEAQTTTPSDTVTTRTWACGSSTVQFHRVEGGGHTWPGGPQYSPKLVVGSTDSSIDATELIWTFFASTKLSV